LGKSETPVGTSFRRILEQRFKKPIGQLKEKSSAEILELIIRHGRSKSLLFPHERVDYGLDSETDNLKTVLVHRPGPEMELVDEKTPEKWLMIRKPDLNKALPEYDNMIELIRREGGADTVFLDAHGEEGPMIFPPNQGYVRDHGFMTPFGAVIGNLDPPRKHEEAFTVRRLLELDIPVIFKVYGSGRMEGGDVMYLDDETLLVGLGYRTNATGYEQIKAVLENWTVSRVVRVPLGSDIMHLDGVFNIASKTVAAVYSKAVPAEFIKFVEKKAFDIIQVSEEEYNTLATNWLCLGPEKILLIDGEEEMNLSTRRELEKRGIDVISAKIRELLGGDGGPRCMTMPLLRQNNS
jgi:N-dimethylarginine dimethylaminohydrolase